MISKLSDLYKLPITVYKYDGHSIIDTLTIIEDGQYAMFKELNHYKIHTIEKAPEYKNGLRIYYNIINSLGGDCAGCDIIFTAHEDAILYSIKYIETMIEDYQSRIT